MRFSSNSFSITADLSSSFRLILIIGDIIYSRLIRREPVPIASPHKKRIIMLCLDGATWDLLDPFIEKGLLPNFQKIKDGGAWGILRSQNPSKFPILWTTIATGKGMDKHGITDFLQDGVPVTSNLRRTKASGGRNLSAL